MEGVSVLCMYNEYARAILAILEEEKKEELYASIPHKNATARAKNCRDHVTSLIPSPVPAAGI